MKQYCIVIDGVIKSPSLLPKKIGRINGLKYLSNDELNKLNIYEYKYTEYDDDLEYLGSLKIVNNIAVYEILDKELNIENVRSEKIELFRNTFIDFSNYINYVKNSIDNSDDSLLDEFNEVVKSISTIKNEYLTYISNETDVKTLVKYIVKNDDVENLKQMFDNFL